LQCYLRPCPGLTNHHPDNLHHIYHKKSLILGAVRELPQYQLCVILHPSEIVSLGGYWWVSQVCQEDFIVQYWWKMSAE
jgi:hypothetical protein